jgi:hypothetical protein
MNLIDLNFLVNPRNNDINNISMNVPSIVTEIPGNWTEIRPIDIYQFFPRFFCVRILFFNSFFVSGVAIWGVGH